MIRVLMLGVLCLLLAACANDTPEAMLEDYLQRVENTLEQAVPRGAPYDDLRLLPPKRERRLPVKELRAGLLDTLDFAACGLLPLIAERNSSLGRVMKPSIAMRYELRFFDGLHPCYLRDLKQPLRNTAFSHLLRETHRTKQANLRPVVWNGIFTSEALEKNLSLSASPVPLTGNPGYGDSLRALNTLAQYLRTVDRFEQEQKFELPLDMKELERHYKALHNSEYGSQLFKSLALLSHYLNLTADGIQTALSRRPVCFGAPTEKAKILKNVFTKYYAGAVQPYMSMIHRQGEPWILKMAELMAGAEQDLPPSLADYRSQMLGVDKEKSLWGRYQGSIKNHTQAWQDLLSQCGLMPGSPF